jgi:hypothetical protein
MTGKKPDHGDLDALTIRYKAQRAAREWMAGIFLTSEELDFIACELDLGGHGRDFITGSDLTPREKSRLQEIMTAKRLLGRLPLAQHGEMDALSILYRLNVREHLARALLSLESKQMPEMPEFENGNYPNQAKERPQCQ